MKLEPRYDADTMLNDAEWCWNDAASFLIRVAPGPNNALTLAAYSGQNEAAETLVF